MMRCLFHLRSPWKQKHREKVDLVMLFFGASYALGLPLVNYHFVDMIICSVSCLFNSFTVFFLISLLPTYREPNVLAYLEYFQTRNLESISYYIP